MALGEYCVVLGWSGDVLTAAADSSGADLRYVVPREGGLLWADLFVVPVDAPRPAAAHRFIAYMLQPPVSAAAASYNLQPSPVRAAMPLIDRSRDPAAGAGGPLSDDPRLMTLRSVTPARKAALLSAWTQLRVGPLLKVCGNDCSGPPRRR
jgi:putrescine transport system substrate-binding protein